MDIELLEEIGLTKSEIKVYLALLELGLSTTGPIVDKSGASSSKIYEILERLIQKGLVSVVIESGTKHFEAAPPERILDYLKEKKEKIESQTKKVENLLPELELKRTLSKYKTDATVFRGMKGMETAFNDIFKVLKKGDTVNVFIVGETSKEINRFFNKHFKLRGEKGIHTKVIFSRAGLEAYETQKNTKYFEGKILPSASSSPAPVNIYGNKVLMRMGKGEELITVMIDNKDLAKAFLEQFNALWNQEVIVARGIGEVYNAWDSMLDELNPGEEYYVMGAADRNQKGIYDYLIDFHKRRQAKGVKSKFLFISGTEKYVEEFKDNYTILSEVRYLPREIYKGIQFNFFKNKVMIIVWREKEPVVFTIEDQKVYQTFKTYFDTLWNQEVQTYEGYDGIKTVFEDILNTLKPGEDYLVFGAVDVPEALEQYILDWTKKRADKKINLKIIYNEEAKNFIAKTKQLPLTTIKVLPKTYITPAAVNIYGNKTATIVWSEKPIAFVVENKEYTNSFRSYFKLLWEIAKKK